MSHLKQKILGSLFCVIIVALVLPNLSCAETPFTPFKAPDLTVREWLTPNGPEKADLLGRPYVVEFFATWCPPCQQSVKHMIDLQNRYASKGLIIIAVSQDDSAAKVRDFIKTKGINYYVAMDSASAMDFSVTAIPTVFVIDHHGQVVWSGVPWDRHFTEMLEKVIQESPPPITGGIHLGPYEKYKDALMGGPGFASAYAGIKAESQSADGPNAATARSIVLAIDTNINRMVNRAMILRNSDPDSAYALFSQLANRFGGIAATRPAAEALVAMKTRHEVKPELYAANLAMALPRGSSEGN
jgi:thiol-disulfide isomerase/thioredoxin